jgi:hypothetical protein
LCNKNECKNKNNNGFAINFLKFNFHLRILKKINQRIGMGKCFLHREFLMLFIAVIYTIYSQPATAQNSIGARSISMGQTGVALPGNSWSAFANVALMPEDKNEASFYGFRYVGISEITDMAFSVNYSTNWGVLGGGVHRYGFNLFNENRFLAAYKNSLGKFHYGGSVSYTHVNQEGSILALLRR